MPKLTCAGNLNFQLKINQSFNQMLKYLKYLVLEY